VKPLQSAASEPDYIYGASLFTDIGTFRKTGLIPEDYFLYWEESHWCQLARQKGIILSLIPGAVVYDKVGGITGRGFMAFYYYTRNGLRFISTFRPRYTPIVFFLNFIRALFKLLRFNAGAARGIFKGNLDFVRHAFFPKK
jgi:GT2 family glycosyltransferase